MRTWCSTLLLSAACAWGQGDLDNPFYVSSLSVPTSGAFNSNTVSGMALWLKGDSIVPADSPTGNLTNGAPLTNWLDLIKGLHFTPSAGQNPTLTNINGTNAVYFTTTPGSGFDGLASHISDGANDLSFYFVTHLELGGVNSCWFNKAGADPIGLVWFSAGSRSGYFQTNEVYIPSYVSSTTPVIVNFIFSSTLGAQFWTNGVQAVMSGTNYYKNTLSGNVSLNHPLTGAPYNRGRWGEAMIWTNAHTSAQRIIVTKYLAAKWGITIPP